ncbi:4Fe-4S ferredoxin [Desulfurococcus amylolyticus]|uniref:Putative 4Fe-4S ferredoxin protein n=1 Tax=Desulfurococcus amylolyticus DSM 16532 TaxID=768672 RepID=I3XQ86_DESAM|nr:4Fe-4S ferredoxin [Desulfurococcus amylolyticus]AFL66110.1 putative 4Fe-4S ferredoxin protein [Desulfurococcus amylolyticus DSM 16532]
MSDQNTYIPRLWSIWVKTPILKDSDILVASACLPLVNPGLFKELSRNRIVLLACPEGESPALYGKLASIIRSSRPRSITVVTIDGSPHCLALHASANEAEYILGEEIPKKHYVVVNSSELKEISPDSIRIARYLSLIDELIKEKPEILEKLKGFSMEYQNYLRIRGKNRD